MLNPRNRSLQTRRWFYRRILRAKIYASPHSLGLILTYDVNYGPSACETATNMQDVHGALVCSFHKSTTDISGEYLDKAGSQCEPSENES